MGGSTVSPSCACLCGMGVPRSVRYVYLMAPVEQGAAVRHRDHAVWLAPWLQPDGSVVTRQPFSLHLHPSPSPLPFLGVHSHPEIRVKVHGNKCGGLGTRRRRPTGSLRGACRHGCKVHI